jgi:hypothetical protein
VVAEVTENLRSLHEFRTEELPESVRDKLEVRIYSLAPAVQMYRWDDKAFISFYPAGELAYDTTQIETYLQTPLGQFVESRFDDLWDDSRTRTLERYMLLELRITDPNGESEEFSVDFVQLEDTTFISTRGLGRYLGHRFADLSVNIDGGGPTFQLATVDADLQENVDLQFRRKYGTDRDTVVRLVPWSA